MQVHVIAFIDATPTELRNMDAFHKAAEFTKHDCTVTIRCAEMGQELCCTCAASHAHCWGWRYFLEQWRRKYGGV